MQHMQDKDFDQLFKDRFEDAELPVSEGLWNNIAAELEPKQKRGLQVYWMAAAIAVMVSGIVLFAPEGEKLRLQANPALSQSAPAEVIAKPVERQLQEKTEGSYVSTPLIIAPRAKASASELKALEDPQPKVAKSRLVTKQTDLRDEEPVRETKLPVTAIVIASANDTDNPQDLTSIDETAQPERKGIRNVGDLVNYVVDKVDKRANKFVKFSTDEDDNSSLTAINIGFIKLNSKRNK